MTVVFLSVIYNIKLADLLHISRHWLLNITKSNENQMTYYLLSFKEKCINRCVRLGHILQVDDILLESKSYNEKQHKNSTIKPKHNILLSCKKPITHQSPESLLWLTEKENVDTTSQHIYSFTEIKIRILSCQMSHKIRWWDEISSFNPGGKHSAQKGKRNSTAGVITVSEPSLIVTTHQRKCWRPVQRRAVP